MTALSKSRVRIGGFYTPHWQGVYGSRCPKKRRVQGCAQATRVHRGEGEREGDVETAVRQSCWGQGPRVLACLRGT